MSVQTTAAILRVRRLYGTAAAKAFARQLGYRVSWDARGTMTIRDMGLDY